MDKENRDRLKTAIKPLEQLIKKLHDDNRRLKNHVKFQKAESKKKDAIIERLTK